MNRIKVEIDDKGTEYTVPDRYDELTREQLLAVCAALDGRMSEPDFYSAMTGIPEETWEEFIYTSLRRRFLEQRYPNVFTRSPKRPKISPNDQPPAFSWVAVHRDLMGDRFYDESKFYPSNVHVILGRLDKVIREGNRRL